MRYLSLVCFAGILTFCSACTIPFTDDVHGRADDPAWRAMDAAIRDTLVEMYGADRVRHSAYPERENHRWVYTSDEFARGFDRQHVRVEAWPQEGKDGRYEPLVKVMQEQYVQGTPNARGSANTMPGNPWREMGRNAAEEAKIVNRVNARLRGATGGGK